MFQLFFLPTSRMYTHIPHLRYLLKHHPFPIFKRTLIDLLASVFDLVTQSGVLIREQTMLQNIRSKLITERYEVLIVLCCHINSLLAAGITSDMQHRAILKLYD